ncbi:MAG: DUF2225 domain-containing protein [SAR324 cluster bacterium]|nr:DUF2225 domain-containing protein [SAR324 cluster bacterium]
MIDELSTELDENFIESLSAENLAWFVDAIRGMILADRHVDHHEIAYLRTILAYLSDKDEAERLVQMIKDRQNAELSYIGTIDREQAFHILIVLSKIALADSKFTQSEADYFKYACTRLGFDGIFTKQMLNLVQKKMEVENEYNRLKNLSIASKDNYKMGPQTVIEAKMDEHQHRNLFNRGTSKQLKSSNNSLLGKYVQCFVCNQPDIPFWILRSKSMKTQSNIFGVTIYTKPVEGKDHCDFNLIQTAVCPKCYFASNDLHYFKSDSNPEEAFNVEYLDKKWEQTFSEREKLFNTHGETFFSESRPLEDSILSYDLAIITYQQLSSIETNNLHLLKTVALYMIQSELFMTAGKRKEAEDNLKKVINSIEPVFSYLDGEYIIRAATLLALIALYFKDYKKAGEYMGFLKNYSQSKPLETGSAEHKALMIANNRVDAAYSERDKFAHDKLESFHF